MKLLKFPPKIQQHLPVDMLSVHEFIALNLPSLACTSVAMTQLMRAKSYVSELHPTVDNVNEITLLLSDDVPTTIQQSMHSGIIKSILCPHSPTANSQRFPLWLASS